MYIIGVFFNNNIIYMYNIIVRTVLFLARYLRLLQCSTSELLPYCIQVIIGTLKVYRWITHYKLYFVCSMALYKYTIAYDVQVINFCPVS